VWLWRLWKGKAEDGVEEEGVREMVCQFKSSLAFVKGNGAKELELELGILFADIYDGAG
jgi:hypothetical protein